MAMQFTNNSTNRSNPRSSSLRSPSIEVEPTRHRSESSNGENSPISALRGLSDTFEQYNSSSSSMSKGKLEARPSVYEIGGPSTLAFPVVDDVTLIQDVEYQRLSHLRQRHLHITDCLNNQLDEMLKETQKI